MIFDTQGRSSLLILNMIFKNSASWPEIKNLGRSGLKIVMCFNFYEICHLLQIEHFHWEYSTWTDDLNLKL